MSGIRSTQYRSLFNMSVTLETSHSPIDWLKTQLQMNMPYMPVTLEMSSPPISWLEILPWMGLCHLAATKTLRH